MGGCSDETFHLPEACGDTNSHRCKFSHRGGALLGRRHPVGSYGWGDMDSVARILGRRRPELGFMVPEGWNVPSWGPLRARNADFVPPNGWNVPSISHGRGKRFLTLGIFSHTATDFGAGGPTWISVAPGIWVDVDPSVGVAGAAAIPSAGIWGDVAPAEAARKCRKASTLRKILNCQEKSLAPRIFPDDVAVRVAAWQSTTVEMVARAADLACGVRKNSQVGNPS